MSNTQLGLLKADTSAISDQQTEIERIYVTRGDNLYDYDGIKCDKFFGLVINGKIYWMNHTFSTLTELAWKLAPLKISMDEKGKWGIVDDKGCATLDKVVTKVKKHHDDIFTDDSMYLKKAEFFKENMLWWYMDDLINEHAGLIR